MDESEEFNTLAFEKKLSQLKDTQECIQSLSSWCLKQREHHKKIVSSWLNVLKRVKVEQRLVLFYLANDVIQYSKRKNYKFVESWGLNLQKATPLVRDEKVRPKILRIFKIWEQRSVYDDEFLSDLTGLLSAGPGKKADDDPLDFQPQQLVNKIKQCTVLEADTDLRLKYIHESHLQLSDSDALRASLKDRSNKDDVEKELNEGIACVERYTQALQREIVARETLLALLTSAEQYYSTQRGEVKVVAYAYKTFGARVRALKRKLDELIPTLSSAVPSPPQRDEDVPSPGPDEDLDLPNNTGSGDDDISYNIDRTFNTSLAADGSLYNLGLSTFLTSENPLSLFNNSDEHNTNKIEVINNRSSEKQDFNISDFLKKLAPNESNIITTDSNPAVNTTISQKCHDALPGLDLLTPESTGNPPPTSFYGTNVETIRNETEPSFPPETTNAAWNTNTWVPRTSPLMLSGMFADTPESPPPAPLPPPPVPSMPTLAMPTLAMPTLPTPPMPTIPTIPNMSVRTDSYSQDATPTDVDHRALPPPPPPPVLPLLSHIEDIDHRLLAAPPAPPAKQAAPPPSAPPVTTAVRHPVSHQDVDHRNLISLTHQLATPDVRPGQDQDYRVPPLTAPNDIVESVDMDLSEDEDLQGLYPSVTNAEHGRRLSFNNNKVLVGGDNGKTNMNEQNNHNLIQIHRQPERDEPKFNMPPPKSYTNQEPSPKPFMNQEALLKPFMNQEALLKPFINQEALLKPFMNQEPPQQPYTNQEPLISFMNQDTVLKTFMNQDPLLKPFMNQEPPLKPFMNQEAEDFDDMFEEDPRNRGMEMNMERNPSPPEFQTDWPQQRPLLNQRFPRNWTPRTNFRPFTPQFWPRSGTRPMNRWPGPRPQRFW